MIRCVPAPLEVINLKFVGPYSCFSFWRVGGPCPIASKGYKRWLCYLYRKLLRNPLQKLEKRIVRVSYVLKQQDIWDYVVIPPDN